MQAIKATVWLAICNFAVAMIFVQVYASHQDNSLACNLEFYSFNDFSTGYASYQDNSLACNFEFCSFNDFVLAMQAIKATVWLAISNFAVAMIFVQVMQVIKTTVWLAKGKTREYCRKYCALHWYLECLLSVELAFGLQHRGCRACKI